MGRRAQITREPYTAEVVKWKAEDRGLFLRIWVKDERGVPITTAEITIKPEDLYTYYVHVQAVLERGAQLQFDAE
jgi:hypothetical protein